MFFTFLNVYGIIIPTRNNQKGGAPMVFNKDLVLYNTDDGDDDGDILADLAEWSSATR